MNEEMRIWLRSQPAWLTTLVWACVTLVAAVIVLTIVFAIWFAVFFESR